MNAPTSAEHEQYNAPRQEAGPRLAPDVHRTAHVARICDGFRGQQTLVLDLTKITSLFDYFIITTATNRRQMNAIADEVNKAMKSSGSPPFGREGADGQSQWVVADYGDVVLHVFTPDARELYDLENLWADAPQVDWQSIT
ncbi:MAG: ribosome silencing factor [Planctomycetaceae bacterium]